MTTNHELDESSIVRNSRLDTLYTHNFRNGNGRFFHIVTKDQNEAPSEIQAEFHSRIRISLTFIKDKGEVQEVRIKKFRFNTRNGWSQDKTEEICLSHLTFVKLVGFLHFLSGLDLAGINERRIALANDTFHDLD